MFGIYSPNLPEYVVLFHAVSLAGGIATTANPLLTADELDTFNADGRWARGMGRGVYLKAQAGGRLSGDHTVSRRGAAEYSVPCTTWGQIDCLPQEAVPLALVDDDDVFFGALRLDKHLVTTAWS